MVNVCLILIFNIALCSCCLISKLICPGEKKYTRYQFGLCLSYLLWGGVRFEW